MSKNNPTSKEKAAAAEDKADTIAANEQAATEKANADAAAAKGDTTIGETVGGLNAAEGGTQPEGAAAAAAQSEAMNRAHETGATPSNLTPPADPNAPPTPTNLSTVMPNAPIPRLSPQAAYPDEPTATMISPKAFMVQHAPGKFAHFKEGPQEVPTSLQAHPYVIANGVKPYNKA